ncbi:SDR family NAD(P)-dependent oxidoreductase [Acidaminobacter sp. JC074]|uniref:SDR family NAD(P)-dependent oxidoreductase n=1 Tax=Acidaminobacter sp. JC074 TaxID=2530199 RepID=UPI001F0DF333|nr:SDR family NAD(P)-dependent oxidoreductase [Acidaminobacter sp. JC074]MCH4890208.1 SDR family NAD(P)-dependent oxidoreductase [Acidaminobacter sp. JC074]
MARTKLYQEFNQGLPNVNGKVFIITGTTSGTGYVAARTAAEHGGEVVLLNRKSKRTETMMRSLKEAVPKGKFVNVECDLQSFDSVRKAIYEIKKKYDRIYCLANNAGIMGTPDEATVDGYDKQMQTNHLSHFLLTAELFPLLEAESQANGDARIVNQSSFGRLHTPNNKLEERYFGKNGGNLGGNELKISSGGCMERYMQTKLANAVFTYGLADKLKARKSNVRAVGSHPGWSGTNLWSHMQLGFGLKVVMRVMSTFQSQSAEDGAMGLITGMMATDAKSGVLYGPKNSGNKGEAVPNPPEPFENDHKNIKMLWRTSEKATGVKFKI